VRLTTVNLQCTEPQVQGRVTKKGRRGYRSWGRIVPSPPHGDLPPGRSRPWKRSDEWPRWRTRSWLARARAQRTGEPFETALEAGRQLEELRKGPHRGERADQWQEEMSRERAEERHRESKTERL